MDKIIELLNEHIEENTGQKYYLNERDVKDKLDSLLILRYFIKWLVDNDKIDGLKFYGKNEFTPIGVNAKSDIDQIYSIEEQILMTLSISDTPIEDLISYLKE